jgi:tetratricopeptide (TPR) repeat protein
MNSQRHILSHTWLRFAGFFFLGFLPLHPGHAQSNLPQTANEWRQYSDQMLKRYRSRDYEAVAQQESIIGAYLLNPNTRRYTPTISIALSLNKAGRREESLPYFEKALFLNFKESNFFTYLTALSSVGNLRRGVEFMRYMASLSAEQRTFFGPYATFYHALEQGDAAYLNNDRATALGFYQQALNAYQKIPVSATEQAAFIATKRRVFNEYTYNILYDVPDGYKKARLLDPTFLKAKILMCQDAVEEKNPVVYKMAALIVRNTDVTYEERGRRKTEKNVLNENELLQYQQTWRFAMDAVHVATQGKLKVETTWIDLPGVTLKGLDDQVWGGLVHVRWLDPAKLQPSQDELFKKLVTQYDGFVFVWDRGQSALAYGSGPKSLPYKDRPLPVRGLIKSMPTSSVNSLHEFLHNMNRATRSSSHGIRGERSKVAQEYQARGVTDQMDWYLHMLSSTKDWQKALFVGGNSSISPVGSEESPEQIDPPDSETEE